MTTQTLAEQFRDAYDRQGAAHFCGEVEGYCENQACDAREVQITVKGDTENPPAEVARCPLCGHVLKIHGVSTFQELAQSRAGRLSFSDQPVRLGDALAAMFGAPSAVKPEGSTGAGDSR